MNETLIPSDLTLNETLIVQEVLLRVKEKILSGCPSGKAIDEALKQTREVGLLRNR